MRTLEFSEAEDALILIDQTRLPRETVLVPCRTANDVARAIRSMQVRGAPAIGVAAAYGLALAAAAAPATDSIAFVTNLQEAAELLGQTRPTAVNLRWALERVLAHARSVANHDGVAAARRAALELADQLAAEDVATNR